MPTTMRVTITDRLFTMAGHRKIMVDLHYGAMEIIKYRFLPRHFEYGAFQRYPGVFKARTAKYTKLKKRVLGHQKPNVWSGMLKTSILLDSRLTSTSTKGRLYGRMGNRGQFMTGPRQGEFYDRALPDARRDEMEVVSDSEIAELGDWFAKTYISEALSGTTNKYSRYRLRQPVPIDV